MTRHAVWAFVLIGGLLPAETGPAANAGERRLLLRVPLYKTDPAATNPGGGPIGDSRPRGSSEKSPGEDRVLLRIGLYADAVVVPDVTGLTWKAAAEKLRESRLEATQSNEYADQADVVRRQRPSAGQKAPAGTAVGLVVFAKVPNVVGTSLDEAYEKLQVGAGFVMTLNGKKPSNKWPSDLRVTHQEPKAGAEHRRGREVSVGCQVKVPNLLGKTVAKAKLILTESHLQAGLPQYFLDSDRVMKQSVTAGRMKPALSTVRLLPGVEAPTVVGLSPRNADMVLRQSGIPAVAQTQRIAVLSPVLHGQTQVISQVPRAGTLMSRDQRMRVFFQQHIYAPPQEPNPPPAPTEPNGCGGYGGLNFGIAAGGGKRAGGGSGGFGGGGGGFGGGGGGGFQ